MPLILIPKFCKYDAMKLVVFVRKMANHGDFLTQLYKLGHTGAPAAGEYLS